MSQPTPGPWIASQYLDTTDWGVLAAGKSHDDPTNNVIVVGVSSRITKANARLIAKAPELAAILRKLHDAVFVEPTDPAAYHTDWMTARAILKAIDG